MTRMLRTIKDKSNWGWQSSQLKADKITQTSGHTWYLDGDCMPRYGNLSGSVERGLWDKQMAFRKVRQDSIWHELLLDDLPAFYRWEPPISIAVYVLCDISPGHRRLGTHLTQDEPIRFCPLKHLTEEPRVLELEIVSGHGRGVEVRLIKSCRQFYHPGAILVPTVRWVSCSFFPWIPRTHYILPIISFFT